MSDNHQNNPAENPSKGGLFGLFRRKPDEQDNSPAASTETTIEKPKTSFRERMRRALARTGAGFGSLFLGRKTIDEDLLDELETLLLMADVGVETTSEIIANLTDQLKRSELKDGAALQTALQSMLQDVLTPCELPLVCDASGDGPFILLVVGVNGVGKTTTIGKLAKRLQSEGKSVMLAAGDTFRAAAVEQLQAWGERNAVPVVAQHTGADSASVIFDAIESARAKGTDVVIADTAGRLHNKSNLMEELKKVQRVIAKLDDSAPHEVLLVLDAGTGQNALSQMQQFNDAVSVTGVALTKLDGTAKGGVAFALSRRFGVPIRFIGVGEGADDLQPFVAEEFVSALLASGLSDDDQI
ncbi:signal recognition particle-docking protein FtsY [Porticoccus sp. W117]|uniref:signal recognition particle-docking protein FtsY n=1 Tax=Porticoccus sp. W117 TaxID=3054777 RepID=UPI0025988961|nr:signal recognition particle-docking protein FtsY [Porticoccus sp. W117]MDM3870862.1 signal recognition particle-docking protein FtsY [Porticoccus sp. W117]